MNQIINIIIRQVMHQLVRRGVSAGFDQASKVGKRRKQQPQGEIDDYGNAVQPQVSQEERRANRAARQQTRQAKQSMKAMRRVTKL